MLFTIFFRNFVKKLKFKIQIKHNSLKIRKINNIIFNCEIMLKFETVFCHEI